MQRKNRTREEDPNMMPWPVDNEDDVVAVDTTWGKLQPLEARSDVRTVGELELIRLAAEGAVLVDCRSDGTTGGCTIPGSLNIPYDTVTERRGDLDAGLLSILFCNGPQCPQSPAAIEALVDAGHPADALAYYRGGMHDWVTLSMPTEPTDA